MSIESKFQIRTYIRKKRFFSQNAQKFAKYYADKKQQQFCVNNRYSLTRHFFPFVLFCLFKHSNIENLRIGEKRSNCGFLDKISCSNICRRNLILKLASISYLTGIQI